jgi:hypothetical protein
MSISAGEIYRPNGERVVVGADGKRSIFHRRLPARPSTPRRVGLSTHVGGMQGLGSRVEVFFHADGELYLAPTGGGEALVSALLYQSAFRRDGITHLLNAIPELRARAAHIEQTTPLLACAPLGLRVARLTIDEGLLLIGDAAGAPDPITGDGIAMAIVSAKPAAKAILSRDFRAYEQTRLQMGRTADRLGRLLLGIPRADGLAARMLLRRRALVPTLLDVAVGRRAQRRDDAAAVQWVDRFFRRGEDVWMPTRSLQREILDDHEPEQVVVDKIYRFLSFVNRRLGGTRATLAQFDSFSRSWTPGERISVLDVASGAADVPRALIAWGRARGFDLRVTALDVSPRALAYARRAGPIDRLGFVCSNVERPCFQDGASTTACALFFITSRTQVVTASDLRSACSSRHCRE